MLFQATFENDFSRLVMTLNNAKQRVLSKPLSIVDGKPQHFTMITAFNSQAAASVDIHPDKQNIDDSLWQLAFLTASSFKAGHTRSKRLNRNMLIHLLEESVLDYTDGPLEAEQNYEGSNNENMQVVPFKKFDLIKS